MKKNQIGILVAVMLVALLGLLGIQWSWVQNAVNLKEAQFRRQVFDAMIRVSERLQDRETALIFSGATIMGIDRCIIEDNMPPKLPGSDQQRMRYWENKEHQPIRNSSLIPEPESPGRNGHLRRVTTTFENGKMIETVEEDTSNGQISPEFIGEMEASLAYIETVFDRIFNGRRPISDRINSALLDSLIRHELRVREITEPFVYQVNHVGPMDALLSGNQKTNKLDTTLPVFRTVLFPHDIFPGNHFLELQFPEHGNSTLRAMGLLLPTSGVLVLIVVCCFGIAVFAWQRQQKMSTLKTDFINNMTHELKTPISTISLALEALGDPDMQSAERIGTYTKMIRQENDRLKSQVERVLQAAALERGELQLNLNDCDFKEIVENEVSRIRLQVERRGGQITFENRASNTLLVADELHLSGIVFNLLDNANKYSPDAPQIEVILENISGKLSLHVKDHGIGMSKESQRRIFEKFYRVPTGDVHDVKGFGLGLSYVKTIATAHGGTISLISELNKGTEFNLQIPAKEIV